MKKNFVLQVLLITALFFTSCSQSKLISQNVVEISLEEKYRAAIADAAYPSLNEVYKGLIAINEQNTTLIRKQINGEEYILVSSWKGDTTYYVNNTQTGFYNTGKYPIWVTVAPELNEWVKKQPVKPTPTRLKYLLGMPLDSYKAYFVEFWVKPADLFRPCPDSEITDNVCNTCFPENATPEHKNWLNQTRAGSYFNCQLTKCYPFTSLGYTYDWENTDNHVGLSEFIIKENANIVVHKVYTTENYISKE